MTTAVAGDRIVVPKMPDWGTFALAEVDKGYFFDDAPAAQRGGQEDLRHTICIRNIKYFSYHSSEHARLIHKKMRAYQAAVNRVWDKNFQEAVETLLGRPSQTIDLGITAIFEDVKQQHARSVLGSLRKLKWDDVEQLVENLFKESGYDVVVRHRYDKEGGDADLVLTTKVPLLNEFTDMDLIVYVQVKNKDGKDYDDVHHVEQLIKISRDAVNCLKVLISTTDEFTAEARRLAQESNVILLDGMGLVRLLNKYL
jgi:HJR/Mrr/RecB family endonuclease